MLYILGSTSLDVLYKTVSFSKVLALHIDFWYIVWFSLYVHDGEGSGTHSSALAWRIPGTGEPGGLPSVGSHRVGHGWGDLAAAADAHEVRALRLEEWSPLPSCNAGLSSWYGCGGSSISEETPRTGWDIFQVHRKNRSFTACPWCAGCPPAGSRPEPTTRYRVL